MGEKWGKNEKETAWANKIHIIQLAVSSLCVSVSLPVWAVSQFVHIVNKWAYDIISNIIRVYRPNLMVLVSARTMTKLDCWLPTMAVQRLRSLEDNSFEIELEQERFWRTMSSGQLPRGLIRDRAWWVDGGSGAQLPHTRAHMFSHTHAVSLSLAHTHSHMQTHSRGRERALEHDRVLK